MKIIWVLLASIQIVFSSISPEFPEPQHFFDAIISDNNSSQNFVFNGWVLEDPEKVTISFSHQNREWDYQWYLASAVFPTKDHIFGVGASVYTSADIPVTTTDSIAPYISSYSSDTFYSVYLAYQPKRHLLDELFNYIDMTFILNGKYRKLVDISAQQVSLDLHLSSPAILNRQLGIRTTNLVSSSYEWSTGKKETLSKYITLYYVQPLHPFYLLGEFNKNLTYEDSDMAMGHILFSFDKALSVFSTYRISNTMTSLAFGSRIELTAGLSLNYTLQTESYDYGDETVHAIGIGVLF